MAYFEKRKSGWMAQIKRRGLPTLSRTFDTKADAQTWAHSIEKEARQGNLAVLDTSAQRLTMQEVIKRFRIAMLPTYKASNRAPLDSRLKMIEAKWGSVFLASIRAVDLAKWRDDQLGEGLSGQSVKHALNLMSRLLRFSEQEMGVHLPAGNAARSVRKPPGSKPRERRLLPGEYEAIQSDRPELLAFVILAIETSMRRSELCSLLWKHVNLARRTADVKDPKNGEDRTVALSNLAVAHLTSLPRRLDGKVFSWQHPNGFSQAYKRHCVAARKAHILSELREVLTAESFDADSEIRALVYKHRAPSARTVALYQQIDAADTFLCDLRFHDLRHEATSRLFEKGLGIMEVASMTGHKSLSMLKRYTHIEAEKLAKKLG